MSRQLAELLLKDRIITQTQFGEGEQATRDGKDFIRFLIEKKYVSETKLLYYLSQKFGLPSINLAKFEISAEVLKLVPPDIAKKHQVIPIQSSKCTLVIAMCDPSDMSVVE